MQFISGKIKRQSRNGGETRLLLARKDGSEFVAVLEEHDRAYPIGTDFSQRGFTQVPDELGRKVYHRKGNEDRPAKVLLFDKDAVTAAVISEINDVPVSSLDSINLAGHALVLAYLKGVSIDDAILEITAVVSKLQ
jgi:hypothetical protein